MPLRLLGRSAKAMPLSVRTVWIVLGEDPNHIPEGAALSISLILL